MTEPRRGDTVERVTTRTIWDNDTYECGPPAVKVSASKLREDIYNILDEVLQSGVPVEVLRKGRLLRIVPEDRPSKLSRLKKRDIVIGDPDELVEMDWSADWSETR